MAYYSLSVQALGKQSQNLALLMVEHGEETRNAAETFGGHLGVDLVISGVGKDLFLEEFDQFLESNNMIASVEKVAHVFQEAVELIRVTLEHLVLHKVSP